MHSSVLDIHLYKGISSFGCVKEITGRFSGNRRPLLRCLLPFKVLRDIAASGGAIFFRKVILKDREGRLYVGNLAGKCSDYGSPLIFRSDHLVLSSMHTVLRTRELTAHGE